MRRSLILALVPALFLVISCGDDAENPGAFESTSTSTSTSTTGEVPADMPADETGTDSATGDGDGDPASGDGDGEPAGDGDGEPAGDGDGDPTTGGGMCGNGVVDIGEQCDTDDLNGFTCEDLGYDGGELACDPVNCTYDASGCMNDGGGNGSGGGTTG